MKTAIIYQWRRRDGLGSTWLRIQFRRHPMDWRATRLYAFEMQRTWEERGLYFTGD